MSAFKTKQKAQSVPPQRSRPSHAHTPLDTFARTAFAHIHNATCTSNSSESFVTPSSFLLRPVAFAASEFNMSSPGAGRIALCLSLLISFLLAASCCQLEFLSPLPFSIHAADSIELRVQVATLVPPSPPPAPPAFGLRRDPFPLCSAAGARERSHRGAAVARGREDFCSRRLVCCEMAAQRRIHNTRNRNRQSI